MNVKTVTAVIATSAWKKYSCVAAPASFGTKIYKLNKQLRNVSLCFERGLYSKPVIKQGFFFFSKRASKTKYHNPTQLHQ